MRTIHVLAPIALALALAACTDAPPHNPPPAQPEVAAQTDTPRLTVPNESVGKGYKPAEIKLHAPAENGKTNPGGSSRGDDAP